MAELKSQSKICPQCKSVFYRTAKHYGDKWKDVIHCSKACSNVLRRVGSKHSLVAKEKMKLAKIGYVPWNKGLSYQVVWSEERKKAHLERITGPNNPNWVADRTKLKASDRNGKSPACNFWRKEVYKRDNWKCKIANQDCKGRIEAHHILAWRDHPELRYEVNNGITLCKFHHPLKRSEESKLSPYFQQLVSTRI